MIRLFVSGAIAMVAAALLAGPSLAQLAAGARAPDFKSMGALGGETFRFHLAEQLREGPVVLYFFPKAFTRGCTLESKAFADNIERFEAAGAKVVGLSADSVETLGKFSTEACQGKVPMVHASAELLEAYDVEMAGVSAIMPISNRTSYVVGRDGQVVLAHSDMDYEDHVGRTLAAVERIAASR